MLDSVLAQLRCPVSKLPMTRGDVVSLNAAIARGEVRNAAGRAVTEPAEELLLSNDSMNAYLVRDGIPILLPEEAIPVPIT